MKKIIRTVALAGLVASPALVLADNCGESAREPLPACVKISTAGTKAIVQNTCSHDVDVKFDRRYGKKDSRTVVGAGKIVSSYDVADFYKCCSVGNCDNN